MWSEVKWRRAEGSGGGGGRRGRREEGLEARGEREQIFTRPRRQRLDFYVVFDSSAFLGN